jgi:hypothetical protein
LIIHGASVELGRLLHILVDTGAASQQQAQAAAKQSGFELHFLILHFLKIVIHVETGRQADCLSQVTIFCDKAMKQLSFDYSPAAPEPQQNFLFF